MALILSQKELDTYNKKTNSVEGGIEDVKNADNITIDKKITQASGLEQDIKQAQENIDSVKEDISKHLIEISTKNKLINYYNNIITIYENEIKFTTGHTYTTPWNKDNLTEQKNVQKNATSDYYPKGMLTTNIQTLPADTPTTNHTNANNIILKANSTYNTIASFRSTYSNNIRTNENIPPTITVETTTNNVTTTTQEPNPAYQSYLNKKAAVTSAVNNMITLLQYVINIINISPYPDDKESTAAQAAQDRIAELNNQLVWYNNVKNAPNQKYTDAILNNLSYANNQIIVTSATNRVEKINSQYKKSDYYSIRKAVAVSLVEMGTGTIFKKLSAEQDKVTLENEKRKLEAELAAYQNPGITQPTLQV